MIPAWEPTMVPVRDPVIVPVLDPTMVPVREPMIVPARAPVVLEPGIVPAKDAEANAKITSVANEIFLNIVILLLI
jgi:hypothetical protein